MPVGKRPGNRSRSLRRAAERLSHVRIKETSHWGVRRPQGRAVPAQRPPPPPPLGRLGEKQVGGSGLLLCLLRSHSNPHPGRPSGIPSPQLTGKRTRAPGAPARVTLYQVDKAEIRLRPGAPGSEAPALSLGSYQPPRQLASAGGPKFPSPAAAQRGLRFLGPRALG